MSRGGGVGVFRSRRSGFLFSSFGVSLPIRSGFHSPSIGVLPPQKHRHHHISSSTPSRKRRHSTRPNGDASQRTQSMLHSSTHSVEWSASSNEIATDDRPNRAIPRLFTPNCPRFPSFPVSTIGERKKRLSTHTMDPGRSPCPYRLIDDTGGAFMIGTGDECVDYA